MWGEPITLLEGENEAELLARFVELCAKHPEYSPAEVGEYVFSGLPDSLLRGANAGIKWAVRLDVKEAIRKRRLGIEGIEELPSKEQLVSEVLALARNERVEPKDRNTAYKTALEAMGMITKQVDKTTRPGGPRFPQVIFKKYDDAK